MFSVRLLIITLSTFMLLAIVSSAAYAEGSHDRTQVGHTLSIGPGEEVSDATCFGCSIRVRGHVAGDVTSFGGSISVEDQGQVDGDATSFGGSIRLEKEVKVNGDLTVIGGRLHRDPGATVGGDVTNFSGGGWIVLIFAAPFIILGLFVCAVVWIVRRLTHPAVPAAV